MSLTPAFLEDKLPGFMEDAGVEKAALPMVMNEFLQMADKAMAQSILKALRDATPVGETGELRAGWELVPRGQGWLVINRVPYLAAVMYGTKPHEIYPSGTTIGQRGAKHSGMMSVVSGADTGAGAGALMFNTGGTTAFAANVQHPGAKPNEVLRGVFEHAASGGLIDISTFEGELSTYLAMTTSKFDFNIESE